MYKNTERNIVVNMLISAMVSGMLIGSGSLFIGLAFTSGMSIGAKFFSACLILAGFFLARNSDNNLNKFFPIKKEKKK